mmetsp:Transcript_36079/g.95515  ORF Transcript_36079/g.95515 Transcript_36079/m.95515 type:complete len:359 (+) Transcript_36079:429-1505(+)
MLAVVVQHVQTVTDRRDHGCHAVHLPVHVRVDAINLQLHALLQEDLLLHVHARGVALHGEAAVHELGDGDVRLAARGGDDVEEEGHVVKLQPDGGHVGLQRVVLHVLHELLLGDGASPVGVQQVAQVLQLVSLLESLPALLQDDGLAVWLCRNHHLLDKDTRQDVGQREDEEEGEEEEREAVYISCVCADIVVVAPIVPACHRHVEREHGRLHRPKGAHDLLGVLVLADELAELAAVKLFRQVAGQALNKDQREDVDHQNKHDEAPEERHNGLKETREDQLQVFEYPHHAERSADLGELHQADDPHGSEVLAAAGAREHHQRDVGVVEGYRDEREVRAIPSHVVVDEEPQAVVQQSQH